MLTRSSAAAAARGRATSHPRQWYELGIFLAAALSLSALAIWRVRAVS
jgi:hypothetical protein